MADNKKNSKNNKPGMIIYKEGKLYNSIKEMERKAIEEIAASRETDTTDEK